MSKTILHIEGMTCGHCLNAENRALTALPGVTIDRVQIGRAEVSHDAALTDTTALVQAVESAGYRATAVAA